MSIFDWEHTISVGKDIVTREGIGTSRYKLGESDRYVIENSAVRYLKVEMDVEITVHVNNCSQLQELIIDNDNVEFENCPAVHSVFTSVPINVEQFPKLDTVVVYSSSLKNWWQSLQASEDWGTAKIFDMWLNVDTISFKKQNLWMSNTRLPNRLLFNRDFMQGPQVVIQGTHIIFRKQHLSSPWGSSFQIRCLLYRDGRVAKVLSRLLVATFLRE